MCYTSAMKQTIFSRSAAQTEAAGAALAQLLAPGDVGALFGGLGLGTTAFVRGRARGLGCTGEVCSPTYALVHEYPGARPLAHFDMYRITGWEALESTGYYDYLEGGCVLAVEWSEHIAAALPERHWRVTLAPGHSAHERRITIAPAGTDEPASQQTEGGRGA
jgi:tRNA threonylcarbamoyladenosine biosynthesis protein TsaE